MIRFYVIHTDGLVAHRCLLLVPCEPVLADWDQGYAASVDQLRPGHFLLDTDEPVAVAYPHFVLDRECRFSVIESPYNIGLIWAVSHGGEYCFNYGVVARKMPLLRGARVDVQPPVASAAGTGRVPLVCLGVEAAGACQRS